MADAERTEPATSHRRREARDKGQVLKSIEVTTVGVLLGSFISLRFFSKFTFEQMERLMQTSFGQLGTMRFTEGEIIRYGIQLLFNLGVMVLPIIILIALSSIVVNVLQVGFLRSWEVARPQLARINPVKGAKRLISPRMLAELIKSILKITVASAVAFISIRGELLKIMQSMDMTPLETVGLAASLTYGIGMRLGLSLGVLACIDYFYQRWEHEKSLRMTRQEVKEEFIRYEGRPEVRQRVRNIQRQMATRRMMLDVPKADVVITNPTHLAVAIKYNPKEMSAPKVVAKGARLIAQRIKAIAQENNVPVIENKPLARMLFKMVDIGQMIPLNLYQAVADVLAYLWRLGKLRGKIAA